MRRWIAFLAALVSTFAVFGRPQTVRDVAIEVTLFSSGAFGSGLFNVALNLLGALCACWLGHGLAA